MSEKKFFVIDFDSTFTQVEALDVLIEISHAENPDKEDLANQVKELTDQAMEGSLSFDEALDRRVKLLDANKKHIDTLVSELKGKVSDSFKRNKEFLSQNAEDVFIVSNGFKDFITPVVSEYGILEQNIFANTFTYDVDGNINGYDTENLLTKPQGKVAQMKELDLKGEVLVIGDGYTDYEIRKEGMADKFYAFTENVSRPSVVENADMVAPNLDEILYENKLPMAVSYPKSRIKVLLLENVHPNAKATLEEEGYQVELHKGAMDEEELSEKIKDVSIIGIRSKTNITKKVLENANRLMAIGTFCIGTNQVDLETAQEKGIAVFNAPFSNTRSVVELALGEIIMLMRNIPDNIEMMHQGKWNKSATGSFEIRNKKLGIIGYGNIGSQLSVIAEAVGMEVYYYDIIEKLALGNAKKCTSLEELLNKVDVVSLHVDGRAENKSFFGAKEFAMMKDGATFVNLARGPVVDVQALRDALDSGKLKGAGVDVFPTEPKNNQEPFKSVLQGAKNLILTPHIGGSTLEAQENIAEFVPNKLIDYVNTGNTFNSVNFPNLQLPQLNNAHRLLHIHRNEAGVLAKINSIMADYGINIVGQYLKTNEKIGYVITDIDKAYDPKLIEALKEIEGTIKLRVLY
ncbi:phosphoglycerate dehydrogenase [Sediminitomix flava]|uniref:D-3-phosphoglycerate dehydrogenase n=1 Tax=Sediminitomix flava TaxID=379075 RepID=A0A315ZEE1_SEDFL|nr:phosphoglycerate dehydrogenase [Sediminitomix flava]PWJ43901.1 D-3-phosphoglycerate dehydrogenase [Sediminitomix flava]